MKLLISQIHLTPDSSGPIAHRQKKSVIKGLVEVAGSVCFFRQMYFQTAGFFIFQIVMRFSQEPLLPVDQKSGLYEKKKIT